jgi:hypothetical protein
MSAARRVMRASLCVVLRCVSGKAPREHVLTRATTSQKLTRKLVHIICGPGFVVCWLLFRCDICGRWHRSG